MKIRIRYTMREKGIKILNILKENPKGLIINQIAKAVNLNRITVSKVLEVLSAKDKVFVRDLGRCKLHYFKEDWDSENGKEI